MKKHKGFALLELFAVIALLSLVVAVAVPQIILAKEEEKEKAFNNAVLEVFTDTYSKLKEDIELSKDIGELDCSNYKYEEEIVFKKCNIIWDVKNPDIINLKISVVSKQNSKWSYINKTKAYIQEGNVYNY